MKKIITFCSLFLLQALAAQYAVADIPENLKVNAHAVIRESSEKYTLKSVNDMDVARRRVVTVLDKTGDDFAVVMIPYDPQTRVSNIKVNMYDAGGKLVKTFSKRDFADYTYNRSGALYADNRVLYLQPSATGYPFTIETLYDTHTSSTIYINTFSPYNSFDVSLQKAVFTIVNTSGIKIRKKVSDTAFGKVKISENGNVSEYAYENMPAVKEQALSPAITYFVPRVDFAPENFTLAGKEGDLTSWDNFGKWYYQKLISPSSVITPQISAEIAALQLSGTTSEKVKKIFQYMQSKTRYVLITMGIGGWQPMSADEVSRKGYGDCKALTNYMRTLLAAAGIDSYYAVIYDDRSEQKFDPAFPELNGNHVVLLVPAEEGNIWLENTSQQIAFNHLSYTSHNRNVLAISEKGLKIIDTPVYKPEESREVIQAKVEISPDAGMSAAAKFLFTGGQYDYQMSLLGLQSEELKKKLKENYYNLKISDLAVDQFTNDRNKAEISYSLALKAGNYGKKLGEDLFFPVVPFSNSVVVSNNEERLLPFETPFPFQDDYTFEYSVPAGYKFSEIPAPVNFTGEFGSYAINFVLNGDKLTVHRVLTINKGLYPKEKFKDYAAFRKKAASIDNTKILITKN